MNLSDYESTRGPRMTRRALRGFSPAAFAAARASRNVSVADLARMANVTHGTIYNWEAGKVTPQVDLLARVMNYLDAPIENVVIIDPDERYPGDWRVIRGMMQPELAAAAGIATTTLRGIEQASAALTDANAEKLAGLLGISADEYRAAYQRCRQRPPGTSA
ncbi:XRE family transcriptional regulator [Mycobacterium sp. SWH-M3]|nr:XRE family transcriptional regulator [Mycobacterium sp. SWH-M3]